MLMSLALWATAALILLGLGVSLRSAGQFITGASGAAVRLSGVALATVGALLLYAVHLTAGL